VTAVLSGLGIILFTADIQEHFLPAGMALWSKLAQRSFGLKSEHLSVSHISAPDGRLSIQVVSPTRN
jgi:hypothetical protein